MPWRDNPGMEVTRPSPFTNYTSADVRALIDEYPLAWVCACSTGEASLLPLIGRYDQLGRATRLVGHMTRTNPLHAALSADPRALVLFTGPQAYISPEHARLRVWGPTWNYAQVRIEADIAFEPERTDAALDLLVDAMESGRDDPWTSSELGERYFQMRDRIIGFRADVRKLDATFKLGQDEPPETLSTILENHPDPAMVRWMRRCNKDRV